MKDGLCTLPVQMDASISETQRPSVRPYISDTQGLFVRPDRPACTHVPASEDPFEGPLSRSHTLTLPHCLNARAQLGLMLRRVELPNTVVAGNIVDWADRISDARSLSVVVPKNVSRCNG